MTCPHCKNDAGFVNYREKTVRSLAGEVRLHVRTIIANIATRAFGHMNATELARGIDAAGILSLLRRRGRYPLHLIVQFLRRRSHLHVWMAHRRRSGDMRLLWLLRGACQGVAAQSIRCV